MSDSYICWTSVKEPVSDSYICAFNFGINFLLSFQLFSMAWSPCGQYLATISKDHSIRVYEPRASCGPIKVWNGREGGGEGRDHLPHAGERRGGTVFLMLERGGEGPSSSRWREEERTVFLTLKRGGEGPSSSRWREEGSAFALRECALVSAGGGGA